MRKKNTIDERMGDFYNNKKKNIVDDLICDGDFDGVETTTSNLVYTKTDWNIRPTTVDIPNIEKELEEIKNKLNGRVLLKRKCTSCGANLEIEENRPIIHCKYCGSVYTFGTEQIYSTY